uniref:Fibrinogen C-terminal domain-containing protein n=1 Tax=Amphimedon queenslandica TaxID=400682 RepID=A0A1X7U4B1_AMPQE
MLYHYSNLGESVTIRDHGINRYILCPKVLPKSCPNEPQKSCPSVVPSNSTQVPRDCKDWYNNGSTTSGVYTVNPDGGTPFEVYCDMETDGGGWTVFQRRQDGSVDFYRNWTDYENGFGDLTGEFWLGLSKIHRLTKEGSNTLRVDLGDFGGNTAYANYSTFNVSDGSTEYRLHIAFGGYSGTAGESLYRHNGRRFSTYDNDNDDNVDNCAQAYTGAWWYFFIGCYDSNLNGRYFNTSTNNGGGIRWNQWKSTTLKFSEMKTRRDN